jgi:hypothetical protein
VADDAHLNVTRWHEELRERITAAQRGAVLRINLTPEGVRHGRVCLHQDERVTWG